MLRGRLNDRTQGFIVNNLGFGPVLIVMCLGEINRVNMQNLKPNLPAGVIVLTAWDHEEKSTIVRGCVHISTCRLKNVQT